VGNSGSRRRAPACLRLFTGGAIESLDKDEPRDVAAVEELCRTTNPVWPHGRCRSGRERDPFHQALKPIIASKRRTGVVLLVTPCPEVPSPLQKTPLMSLCP
jgi:hypothetical protein